VAYVFLAVSMLCFALVAWIVYRLARPPEWLGKEHIPMMRHVMKRDLVVFAAFGCLSALAAWLLR
jgi:hypothetical protein